MQPISKTRIVVILVVTIVSLYAVFNTALYYNSLRHRPQTESQRPAGQMPPQDATRLVEWRNQYPDLADWYERNPEFREWEVKNLALREKAIPLGLDLLGGVDVTMMIDKDKAVALEAGGLVDSLNRDIEIEKVSARASLHSDNRTIVVQLQDTTSARMLANVIGNYEDALDIPNNLEAELKSGGQARLQIADAYIGAQVKGQIEGAKKGLEKRINKLGVSQTRIALQGEDRIRLQVPGERDPQALVENVIKPYDLEFRMVHQDSNDYLLADGQIDRSRDLPVGTVVVPGELERVNERTGQLESISQEFLVMRRPELTGRDLRNASVVYNMMDFRNQVQVSLEMDSDGTKIFANLTQKYANSNRQLAIMLDGVVYSAPVLNDPILDGRAVITGGFTPDEAKNLSDILKAGALEASLKLESNRTVGPTLGAESIMDGVNALILGGILVTIFMIVYYAMAGVISIIALVLNVLIILAIMSMAHATLTLSGIGGILLTIGMAVDANVLIYERIREEVDADRPLRQALRLGFDRAFTVILDSNLTTLLTAMVLLQFTEGSVKGFALTMAFGLLANLFTGLFVTNTLCTLWFNYRGSLSLGKFAMFKNPKYDFIGLRKIAWPASIGLLLLSGLAVMGTGGLVKGVDFSGGVSIEVQFQEDVGETEIRESLAATALASADTRVIPIVDAKNRFIIETTLLDGELAKTDDELIGALDVSHAGKYSIEAQSEFGAQTSREFMGIAIRVILSASIAILIYLSMRFRGVFGVTAVIALIHDLLIVVFLSTLWGVQITLDVVAALMVLLGFSVNDTIVIFDRVRENTRTVFGKSFKEVCNQSMNQSLSRTIVTSGTLFVAIIVLMFVGGESLRSFAKVILIGSVVGTYSSLFMATPLVYQWNEHKKNQVQDKLAAKKKKTEAAKPVTRPSRIG